ncbi:MAG: aliphatic sulfonates ABC transporter substrate-binding protein, partial [Thermomicrobiales bacterium]
NGREAFLSQYPEVTEKVLAAYEQARQWIEANPEGAAQVLSDESKLPLEVATKVLTERTAVDIDPVPGAALTETLEAVIPIFVDEAQVKPGTDVQASLDTLFAPQFIEAVVAAEPVAATPAA